MPGDSGPASSPAGVATKAAATPADGTAGLMALTEMPPQSTPDGSSSSGARETPGDLGSSGVQETPGDSGSSGEGLPAPDLILDPGDPLYNDAPTQTLSLPSTISEVVNLRHARLTFEFVFVNEGPGTVTTLDIYAVIPPDEGHQRVTDLEFADDYELVADRYDEEMAHIVFEGLDPGESARVSWSADIEIRALDYGLSPEEAGGFEDIPADILEAYLTDEGKYRLDSATIQRAARVAAGGATDPYWTARNIHDFVIRRLSYSNDGQWDDAETVYLQRSGSCSEYTFLYIALCRANGVPARYAAGTRQRKAGIYVDTLFHRWAEIYLPPYGWVPVDVLHDDVSGGPRYDYFGGISDERFVTTVNGGDSEYLGWNYHYGYAYDYDGTRPEVTRSRRFVWEPYPPELRATMGGITGSVPPGSGEVSLGQLGILTTNGSYTWLVATVPTWLRLQADRDETPAVAELLVSRADLGSGLHRGEIVLVAPEIGSTVAVPVEVSVAAGSSGSSP